MKANLTLILLLITESSWSAPRIQFSKDYKDFEGKPFSYLRVQNKINFELSFEEGNCLYRQVLRNKLSPMFTKNFNPFDAEPPKLGAKSLGMRFKPNGVQFLEFTLPAKKEIVFGLRKYRLRDGMRESCNEHVVYILKSKKNYEILDQGLDDFCQLKVNQILINGTRKEVKPIRSLSADNELDYCKLKN
ncbi:hypothetical protein [Acinetobacter sp. YH12140]|uniref:hypothetical protein n=1 Tax=Acinetobacter sp. YH12140 TaxID=2601124 RepID=UPI0015D28375|nr:hypothetical protein [Acinetobacter sp. YH12140]